MTRDRDTVTALTAVTDVLAGKGPARDSILLGKYRVESVLGFGGMGLVIRAHNMALDERVAIKFLREDVQLDDEHTERFLREAKAAVRLKSEHVARIRDVGTLEDGRPYMVMELLEGLDLGKLLVDQGTVDPTRAVELMLQACDAIAEAHANGIVHRDIKPTNLFLTKRRDESDLLKVLDFGISKAQSGPELSLTQTSSMLGTPAYMSPEQMRSARTVDSRSDIWALGTVLYELVEGHAPFEATNFAELCVMVSTEPFSPMTRAPHLLPVVERCLEKSIERRYQDVGELASDLESFAQNPQQARRQVARIERVLGKTGPKSRDSTPMTMTRDSAHRLTTAPSMQSATPAPSAIYDVPQKPSALKTVLVLLLLFGIGIAGGLYVTGGSHPAATLDRDPADEPPVAPPDPTGSGALGTPAVIDAGVSVTETPDAGSPPPRAGSAHEQTIRRPPPRKRPVRRPPRQPPPKVQPPAKVSPPPPPPAPVKKCDPFANPKGCT